MELKLNLMKVVLLLLGCTLLIFIGFADEKGRSIEERQMIEEDELPDADTVENVIEKSPKFPRDMYIPDSDKAEYPELTHFQHRYYFRDVDEYSDTELRFFEKWNVPGELCISCENRDVSLSCFIQVVEDESYYQPFRVTAYKQYNSNLYVGDIFSTDDNYTIIGKCIISYAKDEIILSVGYFDNDANEQDKILESGVYYYYYNVLPFENESMGKMGNQVELSDYSGYSGLWYPIYPSGIGFVAKWRWRQEYTYMELEIETDGNLSGCMSQYEGDLECAYAEFDGSIENGECIVMYEDDRYGHDGILTFTFFENGIGVYVDERGNPNGRGFPTGQNYYTR